MQSNIQASVCMWYQHQSNTDMDNNHYTKLTKAIDLILNCDTIQTLTPLQSVDIKNILYT